MLKASVKNARKMKAKKTVAKSIYFGGGSLKLCLNVLLQVEQFYLMLILLICYFSSHLSVILLCSPVSTKKSACLRWGVGGLHIKDK